MNVLELSMFGVELWSVNNKNALNAPMFNVELWSTKSKKAFSASKFGTKHWRVKSQNLKALGQSSSSKVLELNLSPRVPNNAFNLHVQSTLFGRLQKHGARAPCFCKNMAWQNKKQEKYLKERRKNLKLTSKIIWACSLPNLNETPHKVYIV